MGSVSRRRVAASPGARIADLLEGFPGVGAVVSFYRHIQLDLPRTTTAGGVVLLWIVAGIHIYLLVGAAGWVAPGASAAVASPVYLRVYLGLVAGVALVSTVAMLMAARRAVTRSGWAVGALVCAAAMAMYLASRTAGLPGLAGWVGRWDYPLGTFAVAIEGVYLLTYFAVVTGLTIAVPDRRNWHD